jgi:diguanylate cyclase (GGDEF)-like protein
MSDGRQDGPVRPSMLVRAEDIQRQLQDLSGRDLQLWSIVILIIIILTAGVLALTMPHLLWSERVIGFDRGFLPQLFFGLVVLVILFNIYILGQKRSMNATRRLLIGQLLLNERLENLSLVDPLTQLFNHRAITELLPREAARANQLGTPLTFMSIDLDGFRAINQKFGWEEGDRLLTAFAQMLKMTFRGGDVIFRQAGDEFVIALPDTTEEQVDFPIKRLMQAVEQWNLNNKTQYELSFSSGIAAYIPGRDYLDGLRAADRKLHQKKHKLVPVF